MMDYPWPGNVRELQNSIHFGLVKGKGREVQLEDLPPEIRKATLKRPGGPAFPKLDPGSVRDALLQAGGNKVKAARILGVGRATLYRFLERTRVGVS
jgi:transcriptional regulator of acetoin/glycerol metabolism